MIDRRTFAVALAALWGARSSASAFDTNNMDHLLHRVKHKRNGTSEHFGTDWEHGFNFHEERLTRFAMMPACINIMHHGVSDLQFPGWIRLEGGQSAFKVFATPDVGVKNLSKQQLGSILSGEARKWSDLGGSDIPISVIGNKGVVPFFGLRAALFESGVENYIDSSIAISLHDNYEKMLAATRTSQGSLVLGLREVDPTGLIEIEIDGRNSLKEGFYADPPLHLGLTIYYRENDEIALQKLIEYLHGLRQRMDVDEAIMHPAA